MNARVSISPPATVDDEQFYSELKEEDPLGVVIRGLIYIDLELTALTDEAVFDAKHLKGLGLDYAGRLHLAAALGLDARFLPPLRALGTLRNKFAHQPKMDVAESDAKNVYKALAPSEKTIVRDSFNQVQRLRAQGEPIAFDKLEPLDLLKLIIVALRQALRAGRMQVASSAAPTDD